VRADEVLLNAGESNPDEALKTVAALLAAFPDADGVAVLRDGTLVGVEHMPPGSAMAWSGPLYRLAAPSRADDPEAEAAEVAR